MTTYTTQARTPASPAAFYNGYFIQAGGKGATASANIVKSQVLADGTCGPWVTIGTLPAAKAGCGVFVSKAGRLYIVGGLDLTSMTAPAEEVWSCNLDGQCNISSPLVEDTALPIAVSNPNIAQFGNFLFLSGGQKNLGAVAFDNQTGNFVVGETVTGSSASAEMVVEDQVDNGATGILYGRITVAEFANNDTMTGSAIGAADADQASYLVSTENLNVYRSAIQGDGSLGVWTVVNTAP